MLHARIATRAFNTPLLVEPSKAMAFLSGLGPRILGRQVETTYQDTALESAPMRMRRLRPIDFRVVFSRSVVGAQVYELAGESRTRSL
jgi:hypothetical protein